MKYGSHLQAVQHFIEENPNYAETIKTEVVSERKKSGKASANSHLETYEMYKQGIDLNEIAKRTQLIKTNNRKPFNSLLRGWNGSRVAKFCSIRV